MISDISNCVYNIFYAIFTFAFNVFTCLLGAWFVYSIVIVIDSCVKVIRDYPAFLNACKDNVDAQTILFQAQKEELYRRSDLLYKEQKNKASSLDQF